MGRFRLLLGRVSAGSLWDYTVSNDADLATVLALGAATLSGKRVGFNPGLYTTPNFTTLAPAATIVFGAVSGLPRLERAIVNNASKLQFLGLRFTSAQWPGRGDNLGACQINGALSDIEFVNCDIGGNYRGDVDYVYDVQKNDYPEYACITCTTSGGSGNNKQLASVVIQNSYVGDLTPDGVHPLVFLQGTGITGTLTVSGQHIVSVQIDQALPAGAHFPASGLNNVISWQQTTGVNAYRMVDMIPYGFTRVTATSFVGPITVRDCTLHDLNCAIKPNPGGGMVVTGNTFERTYSDHLSIAYSDATPPKDMTVTWNFFTQPFSFETDPGDTHSDIMQGILNILSADDWNWDIYGNISIIGAARGEFQPFWLSRPSAGAAYTGRVTGNISFNRQQDNGLALTSTRNVFIWGNTVLRYNTTDPDNNGTLKIALGAEFIGTGTFVGNSICEDESGFVQNADMDVTSYPNVFTGLNGVDIPYGSVIAGPNSAPTTVSAVCAAALSIGAYATVGGMLSNNYVNYIARTIDRTLEPTVVNLAPATGIALGAVATSNWSIVQGGPDAVTVSISGASGEWRAADDASGTNATAWTASSGSTTRRKFLQVRGTASGTNSVTVTPTVTLNTTANVFQITSTSLLSFSDIDNAATAYSTFPSPTNETLLCKFLIAFRAKRDTTANSALFGRSTFVCDSPTTQRRILIQGSGVTTARIPLDTDWHTHLILVDWTKASVADGGIVWYQDSYKQFLSNVTFASLGGTRTANLTQIMGTASTVGMFGRNDAATIADAHMDFFWMHWGTSALTLPDITSSTVRALWLPDNIGATGSGPLSGVQPKLYYTGDAAAWNANLANKGSLTSLLTKQAGTYV